MKKFSFLLLGLLALAGCSSTPSLENSGVTLPLDELSYDWGDISIEGGDVARGFHFKNDSDEELQLNALVTSCMCTVAYYELPDGTKSPEFGMHGSDSWNYTVSPGEEFEVEVIFDPMAHGPDAVGPIQRSIVMSSSSTSGELQMSVGANVLYDEDYQEKYGDSDFVFEETEHDFGIVKQSAGLQSYEFPFTYYGEDTITVTGVPTSCACTTASISQNSFNKGDSGVLTVTFNPNLHEEPDGKFFKTVSLLTDPELEKQPEVKIWVEMDLDLGPEAYELQEHND